MLRLHMLFNVMRIHMYYIYMLFLLDVDFGRRLSDVVRLPPLYGECLLYVHEALSLLAICRFSF